MQFLAQFFLLFQKGGPVMYFLAFCSLMVVTIAVERFLYYRSLTTDTERFLGQLRSLLEENRLDEAILLSENTPGLAGKITVQGLSDYQRGGNVENSLEGASMMIAAQLRQYLAYLSVIVSLSPLLGLLGTVVGMIRTFSVLNVKTGQPMAITGGVGEALIATATGLTVAILTLICHTYFSQRLDKMVTEMERICAAVINSLGSGAKRGRPADEIA